MGALKDDPIFGQQPVEGGIEGGGFLGWDDECGCARCAEGGVVEEVPSAETVDRTIAAVCGWSVLPPLKAATYDWNQEAANGHTIQLFGGFRRDDTSDRFILFKQSDGRMKVLRLPERLCGLNQQHNIVRFAIRTLKEI
jgi:hypothetical protein